MRIASLSGRLALVRDGAALDVEKASGGRFASDPQAIYERWGEFRRWADGYRGAASLAIEDEALHAPVPRPRQIFGIGMNYADHAAQFDTAPPASPIVFPKFPSCITGPAGTIRLPSAHVDWEVELVVVLGKAGYRIPESNAWSHVAGLTVGQDLTERELQFRPPMAQFGLGKSLPGFGPIGPQVVTPDDLPDPDRLDLAAELNGELVQKGCTADLIFPIPDLIALISAHVALLPGDLIFTGTPMGVGYKREPPRFLRPGDLLRSTVAGIGVMHHRFIEGLGPRPPVE